MKLVMTLMVRDEADIVAEMLEHHLAQGVDLIIATDNGSTDGTREILSDYATAGKVEVHDHLVQDKNQSAVVTSMARRAASVHGATWVINADADEFFFAVDRALTLREALENTPTDLGAFTAPVVNMTGQPARKGAGVGRLVWRDHRTDEELRATAGLNAQPTPDAIHVGHPDVTVAQGNHFVSIESKGAPAASHAVEVLHLPWRSYAQFSTKVQNAGMAYEGNPGLNPSPRHHGMRDYRFFKAAILEEFYVHRHPSTSLLGSGELPVGFVRDTSVVDSLQALIDSDRAAVPARLRAVLESDSPVVDYDDRSFERAQDIVRAALSIDVERTETLAKAEDERKRTHRRYKATLAALETARSAAVADARKARSLDYRIGNALLRPARAVYSMARRTRA